MIVTRRPDLAERARVMRLHGMSRDVFDRYQGKGRSWYYEVVAPGFKYNLTDIAAAHRAPPAGPGARDARAPSGDRRRLRPRLARPAAASCRPAAEPGELHAWHLYVVRLRPEARIDRDELISRLREQGIGSSVHYIPLHLHPYWREQLRAAPGRVPRQHGRVRQDGEPADLHAHGRRATSGG